MITTRPFLALLGAITLTACSSGPGEPPNLPAPEYESPRDYDPDTAIDGAAEAEAIPDAPPPADPPPEAPATDGDTPPEGEVDGEAGEAEAGAGGATPES